MSTIGERKSSAGSVSGTSSYLPKFILLMGVPAWREWDGYITCSNLEYHPPRLTWGPTQAQGQTLSLQHQIPSHSPVVRRLGRHPLSAGITPPGSSGSGKQPKDSHGPKQIKLFCSIFLSYLDSYRGLKTNLSCFHLFCSPGLLYTNTEWCFSDITRHSSLITVQCPPLTLNPKS